MEKVKGSKTSVFVGAFTLDYRTILQADAEMNIKYKVTGTTITMLSNRLSWFYDFRGNSLTLDTACSSSLVALHLACEDLKSGRATMVRVQLSNPTIVQTLTAIRQLSEA
jgi:acyl transferase domain-containing protein